MDTIIKKIEYKVGILKDHINSQDKLKDLLNTIYILYGDAYFNAEPKEIFMEKLSNESILEKLDNLANSEISNLSVLEDYNKVSIGLELTTTNYDICDSCNNDVEYSEQKNMLICNYCGYIKYVVPDNKSLPRSKIGNFKPQRHFKVWMERILGRESELEIKCNNVDIVSTIKKDLISRNKSVEHITIDDIRNVLKEIDKTNLNKNTTLLAKKITGRSPPYITDEIYKKTYDLFIKVMNARDSLSNNRCNRIYYPYYIYKIFNIILEGDDRRITNYIHLHKNNTICVNDNEWRLICDIVPELNGKYTPTIISNNRFI